MLQVVGTLSYSPTFSFSANPAAVAGRTQDALVSFPSLLRLSGSSGWLQSVDQLPLKRLHIKLRESAAGGASACLRKRLERALQQGGGGARLADYSAETSGLQPVQQAFGFFGDFALAVSMLVGGLLVLFISLPSLVPFDPVRALRSHLTSLTCHFW